MTDKSEKDKKEDQLTDAQKAMIELVRLSEEMGLYDTQMNIANKVMEENKDVLKRLTDE